MKLIATVSVVILLGAGVALTQDMEDQEFQAAKPGKHHEHLKAFVGTWEAKATFQMGPDAPPMKSKGSQTDTLTAGGLWLITEYKGTMGEKPFTGHGILGYHESKKQYVGVWVDSMVDYLQVSEGKCSDDGKTLTTTSEVLGRDGKPAKMKHVTKIVDKDHKTATFIMFGPDGEEMEIGTIEYTRKK